MKAVWTHVGRLLGLVLLCFVALQLSFLLRVAAMGVIDPQSTAFQRSEAWRLLTERHSLAWQQTWVPYARISPQLGRAVIASEDSGFTDHGGVDWDALEKAWDRNNQALARAEKAPAQPARVKAGAPVRRSEPKLIGGSTITQQLAKNLFLSGERQLPRKAQEFLVTYMLEALLSKERILEIYLNNVEWGEGVFGAEAAAQHYFRVPARQLGASQAARLAVMLPAPKRFEKLPNSAYVSGRAATVAARMGDVALP